MRVVRFASAKPDAFEASADQLYSARAASGRVTLLTQATGILSAMLAQRPDAARSPTSSEERRFRHRDAVFLHGFAIAWVAMLSAFTWALGSNGAPADLSPVLMAGVLAVFWIAGGGLITWAFRQECVDLLILHNGDLHVALWRPFSRCDLRVRAADVQTATVLDDKDSDGDRYFRCRVELRSRAPIEIGSGSDRQAMEQLAQRFNRLHGNRD